MQAYHSMMGAAAQADDNSFADLLCCLKPKAKPKQPGSPGQAYHSVMRMTSEGTDKSFGDLLTRLKSNEDPREDPAGPDSPASAASPRWAAKSHSSPSLGLVSSPPRHLPSGEGSPIVRTRRDAPPEILLTRERALVSQLQAEVRGSQEAAFHRSLSSPLDVGAPPRLRKHH